jgi:hypothetical protein
MPRESGVSSTPRPIDSIASVSGILDHPLSGMMTVVIGGPPKDTTELPLTTIYPLPAVAIFAAHHMMDIM